MENYFKERELKCTCCGRNEFKQGTLDKLNALRESIGLPLTLNSAFRCERYNNEKGYTQTHATGQAVDIKATHKLAVRILEEAWRLGFTGIGISQRGDSGYRFIHLDDLMEADRRPRPHVWSY